MQILSTWANARQLQVLGSSSFAVVKTSWCTSSSFLNWFSPSGKNQQALKACLQNPPVRTKDVKVKVSTGDEIGSSFR